MMGEVVPEDILLLERRLLPKQKASGCGHAGHTVKC